MAREKKKIIDIKLIIGILFLLVLLIGASYAYFVVGIESSEYNKTIVTGSTEGVAIASIQNPTTKLNLNVDGASMSQYSLGTIYADDEENYVKTKSEGFHDIGIITLTNSKKDDNIYNCTANVTITINNSVNSILNYLQPDDLKVFIRWGVHHEIIDLSTIKDTGKTTIPISLDIVGNNSKSIETYIELTNRDEDQSYLFLKEINIDIDTSDLKCELTGDRAVYLTGTSWANSFGHKMEHVTDIQNIYFVNYIDTSNAVEDPVDLTNIGTKEHQSPAGSIMGWLEEIPKETDEEEQYYNLYVGSRKNSRIYATNMIYAYHGMTGLQTIDYNNFRTDIITGLTNCNHTSGHLISVDYGNWHTEQMRIMGGNTPIFSALDVVSLNVSNFNTKNATTMMNIFMGDKNVAKLDLSNFNTSKVTTMASMFSGMSSLTELDVSSFYTGNVINMSGMFGGMSSLQKLDLSKFVTNNVEDMSGMFSGASSIQELDLSNFNTENVTDTSNMFRGMGALKFLDLRGAEFSKVSNFTSMFYGVKNGITIIVKDEANREWIEESLKETSRNGNVLLPSEIDEKQ